MRARSGSTGAAIGAFDALGELSQREGHFAEARTHYQAALERAQKLGLRPAIASALAGLGHANYALGALSEARVAWQEALVLWNEIGDTRQVQACHKMLKQWKKS